MTIYIKMLSQRIQWSSAWFLQKNEWLILSYKCFFYEQFNATIYTNMVLWSIQCDNLHYKLQRFLWTIKCNDLCKMVVWRIQCYSLLKRDFYKNLNAWFLITMLLQISQCNYLHRSDFKNMNTMGVFFYKQFRNSFCHFAFSRLHFPKCKKKISKTQDLDVAIAPCSTSY